MTFLERFSLIRMTKKSIRGRLGEKGYSLFFMSLFLNFYYSLIEQYFLKNCPEVFYYIPSEDSNIYLPNLIHHYEGIVTGNILIKIIALVIILILVGGLLLVFRNRLLTEKPKKKNYDEVEKVHAAF